MRIRTLFFIFGFCLVCFVPGTLLAEEASTGDIKIIAPGKAEACGQDFIVENIGDDVADLKVVLGHNVVIDALLEPKETVAYNLPAIISVAKFRGREDLSFKDKAMIINLGPNSNIRVRCLSLKRNPTKKKDDLAVFK